MSIFPAVSKLICLDINHCLLKGCFDKLEICIQNFSGNLSLKVSPSAEQIFAELGTKYTTTEATPHVGIGKSFELLDNQAAQSAEVRKQCDYDLDTSLHIKGIWISILLGHIFWLP